MRLVSLSVEQMLKQSYVTLLSLLVRNVDPVIVNTPWKIINLEN